MASGLLLLGRQSGDLSTDDFSCSQWGELADEDDNAYTKAIARLFKRACLGVLHLLHLLLHLWVTDCLGYRLSGWNMSQSDVF
ncbi:MAG: hypothetical protein ACUVRV_08570 [Cyanobacteriota bacterium]